MEIRDINVLKRSEKNSNLYDLTKVTFRYINEIIYAAQYKVPKYQEMRIDLICQSIYGNMEYIDFLVNFNNISNPLNVKEGTIIKYINPDEISRFYVNADKAENVQKKLSSAGRATQADPSRQDYNEQNFPLPPNVMTKPTQQVVVQNGQLKTNGLFKQ